MSTSAIAVRATGGQSDVQDYDAIVEVMNRYNEGVRTGSGAMVKTAFHEAATVFGYIEGKLLAGSIQMLFDWVDGNGPSHDLQSRDCERGCPPDNRGGRVELREPKRQASRRFGARLSDLFQFIKIDGTWKISQKAFHWY
jgi:hypothetical protein